MCGPGQIIWQGVCLSLYGEPGYENRKGRKARKGLLHFSENVIPFWILSLPFGFLVSSNDLHGPDLH